MHGLGRGRRQTGELPFAAALVQTSSRSPGSPAYCSCLCCSVWLLSSHGRPACGLHKRLARGLGIPGCSYAPVQPCLCFPVQRLASLCPAVSCLLVSPGLCPQLMIRCTTCEGLSCIRTDLSAQGSAGLRLEGTGPGNVPVLACCWCGWSKAREQLSAVCTASCKHVLSSCGWHVALHVKHSQQAEVCCLSRTELAQLGQYRCCWQTAWKAPKLWPNMADAVCDSCAADT